MARRGGNRVPAFTLGTKVPRRIKAGPRFPTDSSPALYFSAGTSPPPPDDNGASTCQWAFREVMTVIAEWKSAITRDPPTAVPVVAARRQRCSLRRNKAQGRSLSEGGGRPLIIAREVRTERKWPAAAFRRPEPFAAGNTSASARPLQPCNQVIRTGKRVIPRPRMVARQVGPGSAMCIVGSRAGSSRKITLPSSRASGAPRQWWIP